jgi:ribosomal protein S18 acetylase RimI-like enzyme
MFLTHSNYLKFLKDPKQYQQVTNLLQEAFAYRGVQYFVPAGGFFAALRTTGRTVVACARISLLPGSSTSYLIRNIVVDVAHRGKGLCPKLLTAVFTDLRKKDGEKLYLDVDPANVAAVRCYTGVGFADAGTVKYGEKTYTRMLKEL